MSIIKKVIGDIVEPFAFICNKSFETGIFPNEMKIAKVVSIYKGGDKTSLLITDLFLCCPNFPKY